MISRPVDRRDLVRVSKQMSLALRHRPDRFGLALDRAGWVPVADLLAALRITRSDNGVWLTDAVPPAYLSG